MIQMLLGHIATVIGRETHIGPMSCTSPSYSDVSERLWKNSGSVPRISNDSRIFLNKEPILLTASLSILPGNLATVFIDLYSKQSHRTAEIPKTLLIQMSAETLYTNLQIICDTLRNAQKFEKGQIRQNQKLHNRHNENESRLKYTPSFPYVPSSSFTLQSTRQIIKV